MNIFTNTISRMSIIRTTSMTRRRLTCTATSMRMTTHTVRIRMSTRTPRPSSIAFARHRPSGIGQEDGGKRARLLEVLIQIAAVRSAINNIGKVILQDHIQHCLVDAVENDDEQALDDLCRAIDKFIK